MQFSQSRFNRLIDEVLQGDTRRTCFKPWEVDLLLDIESCSIPHAKRKDLLRRYQKAVLRNMERGEARPLRLSEYLERLERKRQARGNAVTSNA